MEHLFEDPDIFETICNFVRHWEDKVHLSMINKKANYTLKTELKKMESAAIIIQKRWNICSPVLQIFDVLLDDDKLDSIQTAYLFLENNIDVVDISLRNKFGLIGAEINFLLNLYANHENRELVEKFNNFYETYFW